MYNINQAFQALKTWPNWSGWRDRNGGANAGSGHYGKRHGSAISQRQGIENSMKYVNKLGNPDNTTEPTCSLVARTGNSVE